MSRITEKRLWVNPSTSADVNWYAGHGQYLYEGE